MRSKGGRRRRLAAAISARVGHQKTSLLVGLNQENSKAVCLRAVTGYLCDVIGMLPQATVDAQ